MVSGWFRFRQRVRVFIFREFYLTEFNYSAIRTTKCPPLELPENAMDVVYHQDDNPNVEAIAEAMCQPGWFPDLSNGQKLKTKCKLMKDGEYRWIRPLPKCVTCDVQDPTQDIKSGDPNFDVFCTHKGKPLKQINSLLNTFQDTILKSTVNFDA